MLFSDIGFLSFLDLCRSPVFKIVYFQPRYPEPDYLEGMWIGASRIPLDSDIFVWESNKHQLAGFVNWSPGFLKAFCLSVFQSFLSFRFLVILSFLSWISVFLYFGSLWSSFPSFHPFHRSVLPSSYVFFFLFFYLSVFLS